MLTNLLPSRLSPALALTLIIGALAPACRRTGISLPPSQATFLNQRSGSYFITAPDITDTIPVGVTTVADKDRVVSFTISSSSGAIPGTEYTLANSSVVIPAGQATGYIVVKGIFAFYNGTVRKDTLLFTLTDNGTVGIAPSDFNDSFTLVMRGPCVEGEDFDPAEFDGIYNNCVDSQSGYSSSVYPVSIISTPTGPTSATLLIQNLGAADFFPQPGDPAFSPGVTVNLDWSDPSHLTASLPSQPYESVAFSATIVGDPGGWFSSCHQTFLLNYDVLIPAFGFDSGVFTTSIAR
jgi:hypothetical protein